MGLRISNLLIENMFLHIIFYQEIFAVMGRYVTYIYGHLPTFRDNFLDFFYLKNTTDRFNRNVGKCLHIYGAQRPKKGKV
jgi:hypothetical protein